MKAMSLPSRERDVGIGVQAATWLVLLLLLVVGFTSAFLRLAQTGASEDTLLLARGLHRVAATLVLVVIIAVAIAGWDRLRPLKRARMVAASLVVLAFALGLIGLFTPSANILITLANPLGGLAMIGCAWWLCLAGMQLAMKPRLAIGWALTGAAFVVLAASVLWPPAVAAGLAVQLVATVLAIAGATFIYRATDR